VNTFDDLRASGRVPVIKPIQIVNRCNIASYALLINISLGGLLLNATSPLPVGSQCQLAIPHAGSSNGGNLALEGKVIQNDSLGVAVQFARQIENSTFESITIQSKLNFGSSIMKIYLDYFKVRGNRNFNEFNNLLGVSPIIFRKVFLASFSVCLPLIIIPVLMIRNSTGLTPNWLKILISISYVAVWFAIIQSFVDIVIFNFFSKPKLNI
jgi:PilZ domain